MICECIVCVLDGMYEGVDSSDGRHAGCFLFVFYCQHLGLLSSTT